MLQDGAVVTPVGCASWWASREKRSTVMRINPAAKSRVYGRQSRTWTMHSQSDHNSNSFCHYDGVGDIAEACSWSLEQPPVLLGEPHESGGIGVAEGSRSLGSRFHPDELPREVKLGFNARLSVTPPSEGRVTRSLRNWPLSSWRFGA